MERCSKTGEAENTDGSAADDGSVSGNDSAADTGSADAAQSENPETTAPGGGETKETAWTSDASGDVVGTVDPVE